jgi:hypothetical protein
MQEHREVAPDAAVAGALEVLRSRTDDDPVALADREPEQRVADRAADEIGLHGAILAVRRPAGAPR